MEERGGPRRGPRRHTASDPSPQGTAEPVRYRVVFVCVHGSAKSVIAAEHCRRIAARLGCTIEAVAAGIEPDVAIPPFVVEGLRADGIDVRGRRAAPATRRMLEDAWRVVSFGCDLAPLVSPEVRVERWDDVPAVSEGFETARDVIVRHLRRLLDDCDPATP